jgi:hypothetical protein
MALIQYIDLENGIVCPEAYIKITGIKLDFLNNRAWIDTNTYKDNNARLRNPLAPISTEQLRLYDTTGRDSIQSTFLVNLTKPQVNIAFNLKCTFNSEIIEVKSNVDFDANANYVQNLVTAINTGTLSKYVTASIYIPVTIDNADYVPSSIILTTVKGSDADGTIGDSIKFSGSCVASSILTANGKDMILGDFTKFFLDVEESTELSSTRGRGYRYMKTLPKYANAIDDME